MSKSKSKSPKSVAQKADDDGSNASKVRIIPYAFRNEVELHLQPGESIDAYNAKLSYLMGDISSKKKGGSLSKMIIRSLADEELLLRTYTARPDGKGGMLRLFHDKGSRLAGAGQGSYSTHDIHTIDLASGKSLLLDEDDTLMIAESGLELRNDFKLKGIFTTADTLKPRLDNPTAAMKRVWVSLPTHDVLHVPEKETLTIHPNEFLMAIMDRPNAYNVTVKLGPLSMNRVMVQIEGPATVYRVIPELSESERENPPLFIYGAPPCQCIMQGGSVPQRSRRRVASKKRRQSNRRSRKE